MRTHKSYPTQLPPSVSTSPRTPSPRGSRQARRHRDAYQAIAQSTSPRLINLPPCLIDLEAGSGLHHIARQIQPLGHNVRLIAKPSSA